MVSIRRSTLGHLMVNMSIVILYTAVIPVSFVISDSINDEIGDLANDYSRYMKFENAASTQSTVVKEETDSEVENKEYLIPNIAHYIWYCDERKELPFTKYLSVLSASRLMQADKIYFHTNNEPVGEYWELLKKIPNFVVKQREPPKELFGVILKESVFETSASNVDRVKIMQEYGGVIADLDIFYIRRLDPLRKYPAVVGFELGEIVCGGFIMSAPNSTFVYMWLNRMLFDYKVEKWAYISGVLPTRLVQRYNMFGIVHVEPTRFHRPNYNEMSYLVGQKTWDWTKNYAVHLFYRLWKNSKYYKALAVLNPQTIKTMNSTFGQIARKIYYGSPVLILS